MIQICASSPEDLIGHGALISTWQPKYRISVVWRKSLGFQIHSWLRQSVNMKQVTMLAKVLILTCSHLAYRAPTRGKLLEKTSRH